MPHFDHLLRALTISIPMGIVFGLLAGYLRRRLGKTMAKNADTWETVKRVIYTIGIFMFAVLSVYCFAIIHQPVFGLVYCVMSLLNIICLMRSYSLGICDDNGVPLRQQRKPKQITPIIDIDRDLQVDRGPTTPLQVESRGVR